MKIQGITAVKNKLIKLKTKYKSADEGEPIVYVGYTQKYGIYVHENLQAHHPVGQAKFLEQPARSLRNEIGQIVKKVLQKGGSLLQGLYIAGLRLQRESQELCPVDTSALKASAFTASKNNLETVSAQAHANAQSVQATAHKARDEYKSNPLVQAVMKQSNKYESDVAKGKR